MLSNNDKASPGQPFKAPPAEVWNGMVDAGNAYRNSLLSTATPDRKKRSQTDVISLLNSSGGDRARGEILRFNGKALEELDNDFIWLVGSAPTDDDFFGILREPIEDGEVGLVQVSGCCMATVGITDADHTHAKSASGDYVLASDTEGPLEILYKPSGTGDLECVVRFASSGGGGGGGFPKLHAVTPEAGIPAKNSSQVMGSASCVIWDSNTSGALTASETSLTFYNPSRTAIAGSTHITATQNQAGIYVVDFEDCGVIE
jgi:hypothetical protein